MKKTIIRQETVTIPTYGIGEPDRNPMFFEKRVYQGSSGKIYPLAAIESVKDEKTDREYTAVILENDYIYVMILPQLGGRIQRALDKTNNYDFVYYNHVIKPALVGLTGPWISGGIEFNWPQHHRPTTFLPSDFSLKEYEDGSASVLLHDTDRMYGTQETTEIRVYPDRACIEINARLYNPTAFPQTFLWWANPAVPVNDHTQSVFPPDVHAVMDHGKRDVSEFPIAKGVYYKHDYSAGVDISRYRNIPVPTSYMAEKSSYDFVGGYDFQKEAGLLHVASHHVSPGKKQWTWGCGDFGKAWDRNLTDSDGPYIELMTGVFTDNQPDFSWLKPYEEKSFTQVFMPYKNIGYVKNANVNAALNLEFADGKGRIRVYASRVFENAEIKLLYKGNPVESGTRVQTISPENTADFSVSLDSIPDFSGEDYSDFCVTVSDSQKKEILRWSPEKPVPYQIPSPAEAIRKPEEIESNEELFLAATHLEQYRHATFASDAYYLEGLRRDKGDSRLNNGYGRLLMQRGLFSEAEPYFRAAVSRLTWKNPNPYTSEPLFNLGLCLFYQEKETEAFNWFYKATWSAEQQEGAWYWLAVLASRSAFRSAAGNSIADLGTTFEDALRFAEKAVSRNTGNVRARALKVFLEQTLNAAGDVSSLLKDFPMDEVCRILAGDYSTMVAGNLYPAKTFALWGAYDRALQLLEKPISEEKTMALYYGAYYADCVGKTDLSQKLLEKASRSDMGGVFCNELEDIGVLKFAMSRNTEDFAAPYLLGNLFYDRKQYGRAVRLWQCSSAKNGSFPTVQRNLALAYYNKSRKPEQALECMKKAFDLDRTDARIFMELDQLLAKTGSAPAERLAAFRENMQLTETRDDLKTEFAKLLNMTGAHQEALDFIQSHRFHPWEGGEGKVTTQYTEALIQLADRAYQSGDFEKAVQLLEKALVYPENLGEGKLEGTKDNHIYYRLGMCLKKSGQNDRARECFEKATLGVPNPGGVMFYNDQRSDMILFMGLAYRELGDSAKAEEIFRSLSEYGQIHRGDHIEMDYFAVSLPDLQIFEEDLSERNRLHCLLISGLGELGAGNRKEAAVLFREVLAADPNNQLAQDYFHAAEN